MSEHKQKPSLAAICADLVVGAGSKILMAHAFPNGEVWDDWVPWDEKPVEEYVESLAIDVGPVSPLLDVPLPEVSPEIPVNDFFLPIVGLGRVFGFRATALAKMADVGVGVLKNWLSGSAIPLGEDRKKAAMLASLYVQLAARFDGQPVNVFYEWMGTPVVGLGNRCPDQAFLDGHTLAVLNYLAFADLMDKRNRHK